MKTDKVREIVREAYGKIAKDGKSCCGDTGGSDANEFAKGIGYSENELNVIPEGANLGLSCGNPTSLAGLKEGETVLDLGSGAGLDCFLAAMNVGESGRVIGVDMTPEMVEKARENASKGQFTNIEFRLGHIENLPVEDNMMDVVISNCVINLSPDKSKVFQEIYRVMKPGGRLSISDMALIKRLPDNIQKSVEAYVGCIGGAILVDEYKQIVEDAGFKAVKLTVKGSSSCIDPDTKDPIGRALLDVMGKDESLDDYVVSIFVEGLK